MDAAQSLGHSIKLDFSDVIHARLYTTELEVTVEEDASLGPRVENIEQASKTALKVTVGAELGSRAPVGKH